MMQTQDPFLTEDADGAMTQRLSQLLRDENTDNSALALSLVAGGGFNRQVLGYVFGIAVFHSDKSIASLAMKLLRQNADAQTIQQAARLREGAAYYYNEADFFAKYADASFDVFDCLLAAKMCHWHRNSAARGAYFTMTHQTLNLTHYTGTTLPPSVATLDFIRHIALPSGKQFDLAASFPHLAALPLETVMMEGNRLEHFPVLLLSLPGLRTLSLKRGNHRPKQPMQVPEEGPYGNASLEKITIEGYPTIGEGRLGPFPALQEASLVKCALTSLDFLSKSTRLKNLVAKQNYLESVPGFLSDCTALQTLDLSENPFHSICLRLDKMTHLEDLNLSVRFKNEPI